MKPLIVNPGQRLCVYDASLPVEERVLHKVRGRNRAECGAKLEDPRMHVVSCTHPAWCQNCRSLFDPEPQARRA